MGDKSDRDERDERDLEERRRSRYDDEDDDEGSAPRRRRRDYDDDYSSRNDDGEFSHDDLRAIANYQKTILFCILINVGAYIAYFLVTENLKLFLLLGALAVGVVASIFIFMLAMRVYSTAVGVILGILTLVPLIGLIVLLIVNQKATSILNAYGVRVGLLGANSSDLESASARRRGRRYSRRFDDDEERSRRDDRDDDRDRRHDRDDDDRSR